jgi:TonB-dependent starch-binding outer membrane protein SusC
MFTKRMFSGRNFFSYSISVLLFFLFQAPFHVFAQGKIVTGKVLGTDGLPIGGVAIQVQGGTTGTATDSSGNFSLNVNDPNASLIISSLGYQSKTVALHDRSKISVVLEAAIPKELQQVVVVGYGTQKKIDVTGATTDIKGTQLVNEPVMTATQAIQGKAAGVQIISSGEPGSSPQVIIRGTGSILGGANPLYVVDGVITDDISNINTADILSVDILKDASSTAIYGARAANGVILITTRQGSGKMKINYTANLGIRQAADLVKMANVDQYMAYVKASGIFNIAQDTIGYSYGGSTDWYNQILRTAFYQNHDLSLSGSTEKNKYLLSLGYMTDEGIVIANNFNRYTARLNNEFTPNKVLKIGTVVSYSNGVGQNVPVGTIFEDAYRASPVVQGSIDGKYGNTSKFQNVGNPILDANITNDKSIENKIQGTGYVELNPVPWITLKSSFGDEVDFYNDRQYTYQIANDTSVFNVSGGSQGPSQSNLNVETAKYYHYTWDNTITVDKTFKQHHLTILAGTTAEKYYLDGFGASRPNVPPNPNLWYLQDGNQNLQYNYAIGYDGYNAPYEYTRNSYLGRIFYSYAGKYLVTGTFRADGSSVFSAQNRWGYFPGISAGWIITKEKFMEHQKIFEVLKLRAGWGQVGNSAIPSDASAITLLLNQPYFFPSPSGVVSGSFVPQIKDQNIKWEVNSESDVGIDYVALKGRLSGEIDLYDKKTNNALIYIRVPGTFGSQANPGSSITPGYVLTNAAEIENKGIEITARWSDAISQNLSYSIGGNITFNKNDVVKLNGGVPFYDGNINGYFTTETKAGYPIGSFFVRKVIGVFQSQAEVNSYTDKNGNLLQPDAQTGDLKYKYTSNGTLDTAYAGSYQPVAYYGISLGLKYRNFDFSADVYGNFGNKVYNGKKMARVVATDNIEASTATGAWTQTNHSETQPAPNGGNLPASTYFVESGNFIRLNNVTIGYTIPDKILKKQGVITSFRVFANAQNAYTLKKYSGFTAELPGGPTNSGIELGTYPTTKTFALGVNVGF